ncbi:MAG: HIG1 domain-containing protein [Pseudomonadota bacterium]|nr:HIG1 domain-containing protein [Pseudomonadota bacterium]MEC8155323.1 HIG1 domain-containing protein [Pseudomonadota bacterium]
MNTIFLILTGVFLIGTLVTMLVGAFAMGRGGSFNDKYGNLLMRARTICQGGTVLSLVLLFLTGGMGN